MKTTLQTRFKFSTLAVIAAAIVSLCSSANSAEDREAPVNLALQKSARQSSTAFGGEAGRAVDGDTNGRYSGNSVSHTADERESWWEVDLGRVEEIAEVRIWNRTDEHGDRLVNFVVLISERPFSGKNLAALLQDRSVWNGSHPSTAGEKTVIAANTIGRYVRVQLRQKNFLALAEVQVMGAVTAKAAVVFGPGGAAPGLAAAGGQNLALKKAVRQSSTGFGGDAARAVDGNTQGDFTRGSVSHTAQEKEPWWEVDLGRMEDIAEIRLWNRTDQHGGRLTNFYVFVSEWPFFSNSLEAARQIPAIWNSFHPGAVATSGTIKVGVKGRFVRVQLRDNNFLSLAEVEVMGANRGAAVNPPAPPLPPAPAPTPTPAPAPAPVPVAQPLPPSPAPVVVYAPVAPIAPVAPMPAPPLADSERERGRDPIKKLGETDDREQELARARLAQERAEAERKLAEASAAEAARIEAARQEAARKLAEQKAAEAAEAARLAKQKAESEAVQVKVPAAVADAKPDSTAEYACAEFWVYLAAPVQFDSVGHARPADDWNKTVGETMELKYAEKEKRGGECFPIRGRSFEHEFKRERDWYGATGTYRVTGTLNLDLTMITSLTVSYRVDPIRLKDSEGNLEREKDKHWTATITNIPRTADKDGNEYAFALKMDPEKLQLPPGSAVAQSEFVETDTFHVYATARAGDIRKTPTETIRTSAGPWSMARPGSGLDIEIAIKKRKGS